MFKRILLAIDGSDHSERALAVASELTSQEQAELTVVHIVERIPAGKAMGLTQKVDEDQVVDRVRKIASELADEGFKTSLRIINELGTQPAHAIAEAAYEIGADLIVVGTRGHSALGGLLLGSVTQRLLHFAPCPVLAVPPARVAPAEQREAESAAVK